MIRLHIFRVSTTSLDSDKGPPPPGAVLAARQAITENTEPQYSERVPYVICRGPPNSRLVDRVAAPLDVLKNRYRLFTSFQHDDRADVL
jgi:hypothetical protein